VADHAQQILIGTALGLTMQLAFAAIPHGRRSDGACRWVLSFATFYDPSGGPNITVLARLLNLLASAAVSQLQRPSVADFSAWPTVSIPYRSSPKPLNGRWLYRLAQAGSACFHQRHDAGAAD
jgi:flagellar biosynthesis protein FliR